MTQQILPANVPTPAGLQPVTPIAPAAPAVPTVQSAPVPAVPAPQAAPIPSHAAVPQATPLASAPATGQAAPVQAQQPPTPESTPTGAAAVSTEKLVEAYVSLRDDKERIQELHKQELAEHNNLMKKIEAELDERLRKDDVKTFSTDKGAATRVITTNAVCNDWEAFYGWVKQTNNFGVFPKKLNYAPFKEMAADNQPLPPGVRMESSSRIQVRRKR